jgi:ABC-2 type transport system permease protein
MRSFLALIKKDLKGYFDQPTGYILLVIFTGLVSYLYFRVSLTTGEASLEPLFQLMPWWLSVFVAASTMRLIAEEQRDGTLEILLTQPIRVWTVLGAKFLAGLMFTGAGITATIGIPLMLQTAGDLDTGAIIAQYLGTFLLTGSFVAIGLFASSLTRNQIVAFITALAVIITLMVAGLPLVTLALPSAAAVLVQDLSPLTHFSGIVRGVLDLRDVLYFASLISVFLSGTYLMIRGKSVSHRSPLYRNLQLGVGGLVVISLLIGWFGRSIEGRWDLTEGKLYTLSAATENILTGLDDIVTLKLYSSKEPPVQLAPMTRELNRFLDDLESSSDGKLRLVRVFPYEGEEARREADDNFIVERQFNIETQGELRLTRGYLGISMTYANRKEVVPFVDSLDGIEYQVLSNIYRMTQKEPKTIAFLFGHGEKRRDAALQSFRTELESQHTVDEIEDDGLETLDPTFVDVLVIPGPTRFMSSTMQRDIDEYLAAGGKALILVDPVIIDPRQLRGAPNEFILASFLKTYGVEPKGNVVYDVRSNETVTFARPGSTVDLPYPYWVRVPTAEKTISGGVRSVVFPWPSSIELTEPTGATVELEVTKLLETRPTAGLDEDYQDLFPVSAPRDGEVPEAELDQRVVAVALAGTRCAPLVPRCERDPDKQFRMIVATDSDWISESMVTDNSYADHLQLAINWIDWLTQDDALATIRAKGTPTLRQLLFSSDVHRNLVQYSNIAGVPALFVVLGLLRYLMRRKLMVKVYSREG